MVWRYQLVMEAQEGGGWKSSISGANDRIDPSAVFSNSQVEQDTRQL
jgi:hypothetical protein